MLIATKLIKLDERSLVKTGTTLPLQNTALKIALTSLVRKNKHHLNSGEWNQGFFS